MGLRAGDVYDAGAVAASAEHLLQAYENGGYPFCRVSVAESEPRNNAVAIHLQVKENGLYVVKGILIEGNRITRKSVIERELVVQPGDTFSQASLVESRQWTTVKATTKAKQKQKFVK